jgi:alpha-glucosidase
MGRSRATALVLLLCLTAVDTSGDTAWLRQGVIYQIYPRSFQDGCDVVSATSAAAACSGTGTLSGITRRLDYLADLGVDILWISPIFDSPMADFG